MPENAEKNGKILQEKAGNPRGNGILRLKVVEILHTYTECLTIKEIKNKMQEMDFAIHRETLYQIINEITACPTPGYILASKMKRSGKTACQAYALIKIKKQRA